MPNLSFPKNKMHILLLENVHARAKEIFEKDGFSVQCLKGALNEEELIEKIKDVHVLGIRSKTTVTQRVLDAAPKLMAIGAFCIGTNQIDLKGAANKGIPVFNAPFSNTRSVVELALGLSIMLIRGIFEKSMQLHQGIWNKVAKNSYEIRGKKIGIIGYGNIGSQLSVLAEAIGMEVHFYDLDEKLPLGNAKKCQSLDELLAISDVVSLHLDGRSMNANIFTQKEFEKMKPGALFINLSRGHIVNISDLADALRSGHLNGAALDVFPYEPKENNEPFVSELLGMPNVILTPHIGGSTEEAQENIGQFVPNRFLDFINKGSTQGAVNFPELHLAANSDNSNRIIHIHQNTPGILAKINHVFAQNEINILGQYLKTDENLGYVITDIAAGYHADLKQELTSIEGTIKYRELY
jgi:D-3-phosphoglycerate dehydrogenase